MIISRKRFEAAIQEAEERTLAKERERRYMEDQIDQMRQMMYELGCRLDKLEHNCPQQGEAVGVTPF